MSDSEPLLDWLQNWYTQQCDGDWEHEWGVKIATLDNPGW
ncbi:Imm53 family immunity protein, partial [Streptomyces scopuliridis]